MWFARFCDGESSAPLLPFAPPPLAFSTSLSASISLSAPLLCPASLSPWEGLRSLAGVPRRGPAEDELGRARGPEDDPAAADSAAFAEGKEVDDGDGRGRLDELGSVAGSADAGRARFVEGLSAEGAEAADETDGRWPSFELSPLA